MDIRKEQVDDLNAIVTIKVGPGDYNENYEKAIKKAQHQVALPGFRPGKVPSALIKKRFGKSILLEELNKIISDSLNNYISDNKIEILGNPMPKADGNQIDLDHPGDFEFSFELGLSPELSGDISKEITVPYNSIAVDDEIIEKYLKDVKRNYGKAVNPDTAGDKDVVFADVVELDGEGNIVPGGIFKSTSFSLERMKNETAKAKLNGVKKEDKIIININELYETPLDSSISLGIDKAVAEQTNCNLQLTVKNIARLEDAELNQELFDKIYGEGKINSEEEFRNKIKEELKVMFDRDSDKKFFQDAQEKLTAHFSPKLPDDFLKRWLLTANEKPVTAEQIEKDYDSWSNLMKWKLIENKLAKSNQITIELEEMKAETRLFVLDQYRRYGQVPEEKELDKIVDSVLAKENEARKIADNIMDRKILNLLKDKITLQNTEVSYDDFFGIKK
ncbi:MAG: trigger factor [Bacteroidota bacterium]|jgi:trigger factor